MVDSVPCFGAAIRRMGEVLVAAPYWQILLFRGSGTPSFHFTDSQIRSEMHLLPVSFGYTPIPDVV